jgi:hypothetical protein
MVRQNTHIEENSSLQGLVNYSLKTLEGMLIGGTMISVVYSLVNTCELCIHGTMRAGEPVSPIVFRTGLTLGAITAGGIVAGVSPLLDQLNNKLFEFLINTETVDEITSNTDHAAAGMITEHHDTL